LPRPACDGWSEAPASSKMERPSVQAQRFLIGFWLSDEE
jgi:hypothetical protein